MKSPGRTREYTRTLGDHTCLDSKYLRVIVKYVAVKVSGMGQTLRAKPRLMVEMLLI